MNTRDKLVDDIERFLVRHDMKDRTFGALALNDPSLVRTLRLGRDLGTRQYDRCREFMRDYKSSRVKRPRRAEGVAA
jgi:hypothetical protein